MIVLDASALVDIVLDGPAAGWALDRLVDEEVCAPAHQPAEVLSALNRLLRAGVIDDASAVTALTDAAALQQECRAFRGSTLRICHSGLA